MDEVIRVKGIHLNIREESKVGPEAYMEEGWYYRCGEKEHWVNCRQALSQCQRCNFQAHNSRTCKYIGKLCLECGLRATPRVSVEWEGTGEGEEEGGGTEEEVGWMEADEEGEVVGVGRGEAVKWRRTTQYEWRGRRAERGKELEKNERVEEAERAGFDGREKEGK